MVTRFLSLLAMMIFSAICAFPSPAERVNPMNGKWVLQQLGDRIVPTSQPEAATFMFGSDHTVGGTAACNSIIGDEIIWTANAAGTTGRFFQRNGKAMISTLVGCFDKDAVAPGGGFWIRLRKARHWTISSTTLTIYFADGTTAHLVRLSSK